MSVDGNEKLTYPMLIRELNRINFESSVIAGGFRGDTYRDVLRLRQLLTFQQKALIDRFLLDNVDHALVSASIEDGGLDLSDGAQFKAVGVLGLIAAQKPAEFQKMYATLGDVYGHMKKGGDDDGFIDTETLDVVVARLRKTRNLPGMRSVIDADVVEDREVSGATDSLEDGGSQP